MLFYRAALPLSPSTLHFLAAIIRRHRREIGSRWRALDPGQQALLVLVYLRKGEPFTDLGAGFEVSASTAWRYVEETTALLAERAPSLKTALRKAKAAGHSYLILDGTVIAIDRIAADRPFYSGKRRFHGMSVQVVSSPDGDIVWLSPALPGSVHDSKAAWIFRIVHELVTDGWIMLADKGYHGADGVLTPYKGRGKPASQKAANRAHARLRGRGERAFAQLKTWKVLRKLRCCPDKTTRLVKAIGVLQDRELTAAAAG